MSAPRVSARVRLLYAAPAFALAAVGIPVYVHLPKFYTDVVGVEVGSLAAILVAARLFDAVSDPLMGSLSDRTRSRFGRRRPYIVGAALPLALTIYAVFNPPDLGVRGATLWAGAGVFALFLFWTAVTVPYEALGLELSDDYDERTALLGTRDGFLIGGTLVAASAPFALEAIFGFGTDATGERQKFFWMSAGYALLFVVLCGACALLVAERPSGARGPRAPAGSYRTFFEALANRPFRILLISYTVSAFGSNLPATLILYYVEYVLGSKLGNLFLLEYFLIGILFLPAWIGLSARYGKKRAWIASMFLNTGAFSLVYFLGRGDELAYGVLVALSGIGFGATLALPSSMQADVVDYDELRSGERREGQFIGLWALSRKLAAIVGVGAALWALEASGYRPNVEQTDTVRDALRLLYAAVPSLCNLLAIGVALAYPIDRAEHQRIRAGIDARRLQGTTAVAAGAAGAEGR